MNDRRLEEFRARLAQARQTPERSPEAESGGPSPQRMPGDITDEEFAALDIGEQQLWNARRGEWRKRQVLSLPLGSPDDMSLFAYKRASLVNTAADGSINQSIKVEENTLRRKRSDDVLPRLLALLKREDDLTAIKDTC